MSAGSCPKCGKLGEPGCMPSPCKAADCEMMRKNSLLRDILRESVSQRDVPHEISADSPYQRHAKKEWTQ